MLAPPIPASFFALIAAPACGLARSRLVRAANSTFCGFRGMGDEYTSRREAASVPGFLASQRLLGCFGSSSLAPDRSAHTGLGCSVWDAPVRCTGAYLPDSVEMCGLFFQPVQLHLQLSDPLVQEVALGIPMCHFAIRSTTEAFR